MGEQEKTQNLTSIVAFGQLKVRIYLETADKRIDDENMAVNFGISAQQAVSALKKVDEALFQGLFNYDDGMRSFVRR